MNDKPLNDLLAQIEALDSGELRVEALLVFDTQATKHYVLRITHDATVEALVGHFGIDAGPVFRWLFREDLTGTLMGLGTPEVQALSRRGCAYVLSSKAFGEVCKALLDGPHTGEVTALKGVKIFYLNGK